MKQETITLLIAMWGAILSTVAFVWNILRARKDRGNIQVTADFTFVSKEEYEHISGENSLILNEENDPRERTINLVKVTLFNIGKRPATLKNIQVFSSAKLDLEMENKTLTFNRVVSVLDEGFPLTLEEGGFHTEYLKEHSGESMYRLVAEDIEGRKYRLSKGALKNLKKKAKQYKLTDKERTQRFVEAYMQRKKESLGK